MKVRAMCAGAAKRDTMCTKGATGRGQTILAFFSHRRPKPVEAVLVGDLAAAVLTLAVLASEANERHKYRCVESEIVLRK